MTATPKQRKEQKEKQPETKKQRTAQKEQQKASFTSASPILWSLFVTIFNIWNRFWAI